MPYAKTKDNRLVNEVTLGDGYPLSNDLKPLKIGGEASILEISSPLPDGTDNGQIKVNGDLDITGTLKTKLSHDLIYDFDDEVNTLAQVKIDALIDSAPGALDTLNELAAALGDDANFSTTVTNSLATKVGLTGNETVAGEKTFSSTLRVGDGTEGIRLLNISSNIAGIYGVDTGGSAWNSIHIKADGDDGLFIEKDTNKVGIGNTSPNHLLHVGDDVTATFTTAPDKAIQLSSSTNDHEIAYILYAGEGTNNIRSKYYVDDATKYVGWDSTHSTGWLGYEWKVAGTQQMKLSTSGGLTLNHGGWNGMVINNSANTNGSHLELKNTERRFQVAVRSNSFDIRDVTASDTSRFNINSSGNITIGGTIDGRDLATDGTKLDGIEASATADQTKSDIEGLGIQTVGVITSGTWNGSQIASAYLDTDTAHLSTTQTFTGLKTFNEQITIHSDSDAMLNFKTSDDSWAYMQFLENDGTRRAYIGMDNDLNRLIINANENGANEVEINTTTVDMNAELNISGNIVTAGLVDGVDIASRDAVLTSTTTTANAALPLAGGDMTGHLQITATDGSHSGNGAYVPSGTDWQNVLRLGSTGDNGINFLVNDGGTNKVSYYTNRWGSQHEWARGSQDTGDGNTYQPMMRLTSNDSNTNWILYDGTSNTANVRITAESSNDTYFNNSANNVAIGSSSAGGYKLQVTGTANVTSDLTVGTNTLFVDSSNNEVGINTTSPASALHVEEGDIRIDTASGGNQALRFSEANNTRAQIQYKSGDEELNFITDNASGSDTTRMTIKSEQDATAIGIGTTSPQADLHINNSSGTKLYLTASDSNPAAAAAIRFSEQEDGANNYFEIDYNGNLNTLAFHSNNQGDMFTLDRSNNKIYTGTAKVGIGTTSPTTTLDVEGTVSYKHTAFTTAGPTDNVDVSDTTVLEVDTSGGSVTIGGFTGGVQGQILYVIKTTSDFYTLKLENNEGGGSQDIYSSSNSDISIVRIRGGVTLYCNGTSWFVLNK